MKAIENKWFVGEKYCLDSTTSDSPIQLDHHSFQALFLIVFGISLLLLLLMLVCKRYKERQGNEIEAPPNPPSEGPDTQANVQDSQNRDVNVVQEEVNEEGDGRRGDGDGGGDEADNHEHHIVEVREDHHAGDGNEAYETVGVEAPSVQLLSQKSQASTVRRKKIISKSVSPLPKVGPPLRMKSA